MPGRRPLATVAAGCSPGAAGGRRGRVVGVDGGRRAPDPVEHRPPAHQRLAAVDGEEHQPAHRTGDEGPPRGAVAQHRGRHDVHGQQRHAGQRRGPQRDREHVDQQRRQPDAQDGDGDHAGRRRHRRREPVDVVGAGLDGLPQHREGVAARQEPPRRRRAGVERGQQQRERRSLQQRVHDQRHPQRPGGASGRGHDHHAGRRREEPRGVGEQRRQREGAEDRGDRAGHGQRQVPGHQRRPRPTSSGRRRDGVVRARRGRRQRRRHGRPPGPTPVGTRGTAPGVPAPPPRADQVVATGTEASPTVARQPEATSSAAAVAARAAVASRSPRDCPRPDVEHDGQAGAGALPQPGDPLHVGQAEVAEHGDEQAVTDLPPHGGAEAADGAVDGVDHGQRVQQVALEVPVDLLRGQRPAVGVDDADRVAAAQQVDRGAGHERHRGLERRVGGACRGGPGRGGPARSWLATARAVPPGAP